MQHSLQHRIIRKRMSAKQMRDARKALKLTHAEFAKVVGCTISSITAWQSDVTEYRAPAYVSELVRAFLAGYRSDDWPKEINTKP